MSAESRAERTGVVIVASTSAAAGTTEDLTGPLIRTWLLDRGFTTAPEIIVPDGDPVGVAVSGALSSHPSVLITTGGTGVSPTDRTPEMVTPKLDVQLPGLIEEIRRRGLESTSRSIITRGVSGFSGKTFVITLPGSRGGVTDGLAVLDDVLEHLLQQRSGNGPRHD